MLDAGVMPERTDRPRYAWSLLDRDGACVLHWGSVRRADVVAAARAVLGERLRVQWEPRTLRPNPVPGRAKRIVRAERLILESTVMEGTQLLGKALPVQIEGWGLGAARPDFLAFLCAEAPPEGGESYLLDATRLLAALAEDPHAAELVAFLWGSGGSGAGERQGDDALVHRTRQGRVAVSYQAPVPAGDAIGLEHRREMVALWQQLVRDAAAAAPRLSIPPGDVLMIDNYRVMHGRESYRGERVVHRGWFWTDLVFSWPMVTEIGDDS